MARRNRLSWRDDRADLLCSGRDGLAIQVEEPALAENAAFRHQLIAASGELRVGNVPCHYRLAT